jgi:prepilin-type processing-associated H-X9-DG protein
MSCHAGGIMIAMGDGSVRSIGGVSPDAIADRFGTGPITFGVDAQVEGKLLNFETQIDPSSESLSFDLILPYVVDENPDLDLRLSGGGFLECFLTQYSIVSPRDSASGLPTGKRQHKPMVITKEWDKATPLLMQALVSNENITELPTGEVELNFTVTGEGQNLDR